MNFLKRIGVNGNRVVISQSTISMTSFKPFILLTAGLLLPYSSQAQDNQDAPGALHTKQLSQTVRGRVMDAASQQPLAGVVIVLVSDNSINASTDGDGYFTLNNVPLGR